MNAEKNLVEDLVCKYSSITDWNLRRKNSTLTLLYNIPKDIEVVSSIYKFINENTKKLLYRHIQLSSFCRFVLKNFKMLEESDLYNTHFCGDTYFIKDINTLLSLESSASSFIKIQHCNNSNSFTSDISYLLKENVNVIMEIYSVEELLKVKRYFNSFDINIIIFNNDSIDLPDLINTTFINGNTFEEITTGENKEKFTNYFQVINNKQSIYKEISDLECKYALNSLGTVEVNSTGIEFTGPTFPEQTLTEFINTID